MVSTLKGGDGVEVAFVMQVTLTDGNAEAVKACLQTMRQNGVPATYMPLSSEDPAEGCLQGLGSRVQNDGRNTLHEKVHMQQVASSTPDVVVSVSPWGKRRVAAADVLLGADVVYDPEVVPALVQQLLLDLRGPCTALIASVERCASTLAAFMHACITCGLRVQEVCRERLLHAATRQCEGKTWPAQLYACAALEQEGMVVLHRVSCEGTA